MPIRISTIASRLLILSVVSVGSAHAQYVDEEINLDRSGIVYSIGQVERIIKRSAVIDLGDAHTLRREQMVAVFRPTSNYFTPIGVLKIDETFPTSSQAYPSTTKVKVGDLVMFVREFSELRPAAQHLNDFVKRQIVKTSGTNSYTTRQNTETAMALLTYERKHPRWEKKHASVIGYLNGDSYSEGGEKSVERLLNQINQIRKHYRTGLNSLQAFGPKWNQVMQVLVGRTAKLQHMASQVGNADLDAEDEEKGVSVRDIKRIVGSELFDRSAEERKLVSYLVATALEVSPNDTDQWVRQQAEQSQFARLTDEEVIMEGISDLIRTLREQ